MNVTKKPWWWIIHQIHSQCSLQFHMCHWNDDRWLSIYFKRKFRIPLVFSRSNGCVIKACRSNMLHDFTVHIPVDLLKRWNKKTQTTKKQWMERNNNKNFVRHINCFKPCWKRMRKQERKIIMQTCEKRALGRNWTDPPLPPVNER